MKTLQNLRKQQNINGNFTVFSRIGELLKSFLKKPLSQPKTNNLIGRVTLANSYVGNLTFA